MKINTTVKWIGIVGGLAGMCFAAFAVFNKQNEVLTTPTPTVTAVEKNKVSTISMRNEAILGLDVNHVNNSKTLTERINDVHNGIVKT